MATFGNGTEPVWTARAVTAPAPVLTGTVRLAYDGGRSRVVVWGADGIWDLNGATGTFALRESAPLAYVGAPRGNHDAVFADGETIREARREILIRALAASCRAGSLRGGGVRRRASHGRAGCRAPSGSPSGATSVEPIFAAEASRRRTRRTVESRRWGSRSYPPRGAAYCRAEDGIPHAICPARVFLASRRV